jgi:hypothetical protein
MGSNVEVLEEALIDLDNTTARAIDECVDDLISQIKNELSYIFEKVLSKEKKDEMIFEERYVKETEFYKIETDLFDALENDIRTVAGKFTSEILDLQYFTAKDFVDKVL